MKAQWSGDRLLLFFATLVLVYRFPPEVSQIHGPLCVFRKNVFFLHIVKASLAMMQVIWCLRECLKIT